MNGFCMEKNWQGPENEGCGGGGLSIAFSPPKAVNICGHRSLEDYRCRVFRYIGGV